MRSNATANDSRTKFTHKKFGQRQNIRARTLVLPLLAIRRLASPPERVAPGGK